MKNKKLAFSEFIEQYNPFGVLDSNKEVMKFETTTDCYRYVIKEIIRLYPRGYIEIPLLIHELTGMPYRECRQFFNDTIRGYYKVDEVELVELWELNDMTESGSTARKRLLHIIDSLHTISETCTNKESYYFALQLLRKDIAEYKRRVYISEGVIRVGDDNMNK